MRSAPRIRAIAASLGLVMLTAACGNDTATPTTPTPTPTGPTTSIFSSRLTPGGAVSRLFDASAAGTVTVMLTNAAGPFTRVGIGIGVPTNTTVTGIARCSLSTAIATASGSTPQITTTVDAGPYCVAIYDLGTLTDTIDFSITLVYP